MKVKVTWEFEADVEDCDPKSVDICGLAKDLTKHELDYSLKHGQLTAGDFEYSVVLEGKEDV